MKSCTGQKTSIFQHSDYGLLDMALRHVWTHGFFEGDVWWIDALHTGEACV